MKLAYIIKKPLITERTLQNAKKGEYTFAVDASATKGQIREAIESAFEVSVVRVRTTKIPSGTKRVGKRRLVTAIPAGKKATVSLQDGQKIDIFEVGSE